MDMSLLSDEQREKAARWGELGELGMEGALRKCGASERVIDRLITQLQLAVADLDDSQTDWDDLESVYKCDWGSRKTRMNVDKCVVWDLSKIEKDLNIDDAKCVFLAVLGRGAPLVKSLAVPVRVKLPHHFRFSEGLYQVNIVSERLSEDELIALSVNLAASEHLRELCFSAPQIVEGDIGAIVLANAFAANMSIRLVCDSGASSRNSFGINVLKVNKNVRVLRFRYSTFLEAEKIIILAQLLKANTTLKFLDVGGVFDPKAFKTLSSSLRENTSLSKFIFRFSQGELREQLSTLACNLLLAPFIHDGSESAGRKNTTIASLHIVFPEKLAPLTASDLSAVIETNRILTELRIENLSLSTDEWAKHVVPALGWNGTLKHLGLDACQGLGPAYDSIVEVVKSSNTNLDTITLRNTDLVGKEAGLAYELRINKEYRLKLRGQPTQKSTTSRLVLCGYQFAGKTSISKTAARLQEGTRLSSRQNIHMVLSKFLQSRPRLRQLLFGTDSVLETQFRTRGIEIVRLEGTQMSVWDFAGQAEYYALHDYLFPNSENSCFLYVCNAKCPATSQNNGRREVMEKEAMRDQFNYWLRFIVSNTKPAQGVSVNQKRLPHVIFVLTGKDTLGEAEQRISEEAARDIVFESERKFQEVLSLSQKVEFINAHDGVCVEKLLTTVKDVVNEILGGSTEYVICADVRDQLSRWVRRNPSRPLVSQTDFQQQIWEKVRGYDTIGMHTVLAYLNDVGDVIYFKSCGFIVVNPRWFGVGILGSLIDAFAGKEAQDTKARNGLCGPYRSKSFKENAWKPRHENGFVQRGRIDDLLQASLQSVSQVVASDDLVKLMIDLELCFQERPDDVGSRLFIPALFDEGSDEDARKGLRKLNWEAKFPPLEQEHFMGRRLECENKSLTFLTPGFFPRLQVVLGNMFHEWQWAGLRVASNLFGFVYNGMEVLVEYSGDIDYFFDILVRSTKSREETLRFIEDVVIQKIREFCASPQGCQGVELVEAVIRPICVKKLDLCAERKHHAVLVSDLSTSMSKGDGKSYRHTWSKEIPSVYADDFALDLLEGEGSYRNCIAANQVDVSEGSSSIHATGVAPEWSGNSQLWNAPDLPKRFYPTVEDLGFMTKVNAMTNLARVIPIKLHLMCDGLDGVDDPHVVKGQPGRTLKLNEKLGGNDFPILKYAVQLLWAGARVAASTINISLEVAEIHEKVKQMSSSPVEQVSVDTLRSITEQSSVSGGSAAHEKIKPKDILHYLEEYMRMDPFAQWLVDFLNLRDMNQFRRDFKLDRMRKKKTKDIIWVCHDHYVEGVRNDIVESAPVMSW